MKKRGIIKEEYQDVEKDTEDITEPEPTPNQPEKPEDTPNKPTLTPGSEQSPLKENPQPDSKTEEKKTENP
jgi:monofunctional biosynthetic peptidoglycan transglycosylase